MSDPGTEGIKALLTERLAPYPESKTWVPRVMKWVGKIGKQGALHMSIRNGWGEVAQVLVADCNANVNVKDKEGRTPLVVAASQGQQGLCQLLVGVGAQPLLPDSHGQTAIDMAAAGGHDQLVSYLQAVVLVDDFMAERATALEALQGPGAGAVAWSRSKGWRSLPDDWREQLLHETCTCGRLPVMKALVQLGANVGLKWSRTGSLLHVACRKGYDAIVDWLLLDQPKATTDTMLHMADPKGETPLYIACAHGRLGCVKALVRAGAAVGGGCHTDGSTALHAAVKGEQLEVVDFLIEQAGADVNATDLLEGRSVLDWACYVGSVEVVKRLLKAGATVYRSRGDQWTALEAATRFKHVEVVRVLEARLAWLRQGLEAACESGSVEQAVSMLELGADARGAWGGSSHGNTPLHMAASRGHEGVVRALIDWGAGVEAQNSRGQTALALACQAGHEGVMSVLLEEGARFDGKQERASLFTLCRKGMARVLAWLLDHDLLPKVNAANPKGETLLSVAVEHGHERVVQLLVERGQADVNKGDCLSLAIQNGWLSLAEYLIEHGAATAEEEEEGSGEAWSALQEACEVGALPLVELLVANGLSVESRQPDTGMTPLMLAAAGGHLDVVAFLVEYGHADVHAQDGKGRTALWHAKKKAQTAVVQLLECVLQQLQERDRDAKLPQPTMPPPPPPTTTAASQASSSKAAVAGGQQQRQEEEELDEAERLRRWEVQLAEAKERMQEMRRKYREQRKFDRQRRAAQRGAAGSPPQQQQQHDDHQHEEEEEHGEQQQRGSVPSPRGQQQQQHPKHKQKKYSKGAAHKANGGHQHHAPATTPQQQQQPLAEGGEAAAAAGAGAEGGGGGGASPSLGEDERGGFPKQATPAERAPAKPMVQQSKKNKGGRYKGGKFKEDAAVVAAAGPQQGARQGGKAAGAQGGGGGGNSEAVAKGNPKQPPPPPHKGKQHQKPQQPQHKAKKEQKGSGLSSSSGKSQQQPAPEEEDAAVQVVVDEEEAVRLELEERLTCPIAQELLSDPVRAADGNTYERSAIERWMRECLGRGLPVTSPLTGLPLAHRNLVRDDAACCMVRDYCHKYGVIAR